MVDSKSDSTRNDPQIAYEALLRIVRHVTGKVSSRQFLGILMAGSSGLLIKFALLPAGLFFELFLPSSAFLLKFGEGATRSARHTSSHT